MLQQTMPRAQSRSHRTRRYLRFRHRRAFGRPWLEIICLVGMIVVLAVAGSQFVMITHGMI